MSSSKPWARHAPFWPPTARERARWHVRWPPWRTTYSHLNPKVRSHFRIHRPDGATPGRNEPCPCGSGKKSKRCCYR